MSHDRHLIDTIKGHFARKSLVQLQEIVRANDQERWSPEAVVAAGEVLRDRLAGHAQEPQVAEEERPPPPLSVPDPFSLGLIGLGILSGLGGFAIIPVYRPDYSGGTDPDLPVPFGSKAAWLALDTRDTQAVAAALELRDARTATWAEGVRAAYQSSIYVTPPLADWTLVVGTALFPPDRVETFTKPLLERLSRQFDYVQYFCTHREFELHVWACARQGRLVRGYGWLGAKGLTLWNEGAQTREERVLGLSFSDGPSPTGALPDEDSVMQLANLWSIDPTSLNEDCKEPSMGLLGMIAGGNRAHDQSR
jgi:hypothetical protein